MQEQVVRVNLKNWNKELNAEYIEKYTIEKRIVQQTCPRLIDLEDVDSDHQTVVTLSADQSIPYSGEAHELLVYYAAKGSLPHLDEEDDDDVQSLLVTAWHIGGVLELPHFQNAVMLKLLEAGLQESTPKDAIAFVFENYSAGSAIWKFMAAQVALAIVQSQTMDYAALNDFQGRHGVLAGIHSALAEYYSDTAAFHDLASQQKRDKYMVEE